MIYGVRDCQNCSCWCLCRIFKSKNRNGSHSSKCSTNMVLGWSCFSFPTRSQGTCKPGECKFPIEVPEIDLTEVIEVLHVTKKAKKSIAEVPIWQINQ